MEDWLTWNWQPEMHLWRVTTTKHLGQALKQTDSFIVKVFHISNYQCVPTNKTPKYFLSGKQLSSHTWPMQI